MIYNDLEVRLWKTDAQGRGIYVSPDGKVLREVKPWDGNANRGKKGYPCVSVANKNIPVHLLVASCYLDNDDPEHKIDVAHKDDNKYNSDVSNLEWVTPSKNNLDAYKRGLKSNCLKVKCVETGMVYFSCGEASRQIRGDTSAAETIRLCARGKLRTSCGYTWEVVND